MVPTMMAGLPRLASWRRLPAVMAGIALALSGLASADKSAGDYFVHDLPGAPEGPLIKMHAGCVWRSRHVLHAPFV